MTTTCAAGCGRPAEDGRMCHACTNGLMVDLGDVPAIAAELETLLAKQTAYDDRVGGRTAEDPMPIDWNASIMLGALRNTLSTWVRVLLESFGRGPHGPRCRGRCAHGSCVAIRLRIPPADNLDTMALWLQARQSRIRVHEAAAELYDEITGCVESIRRQIDRPSDRIEVGPCGQKDDEGEPCTGSLGLWPGAPEARCSVCGYALSTDDLLAYADDKIGTAQEVTRLLRILGWRIGASTVRQWASRGRLTTRGTTPQGWPTYRVGDIYSLLWEMEQSAS